MKRTLGRPTYAFEARQYVVSAPCVRVRVLVRDRGRRRPIWNVFRLVKAMCGACTSLSHNDINDDSLREDVTAKRGRKQQTANKEG